MSAPTSALDSLSTTDDWATPWSLFRELDHEYHFNLDVAATDLNTKCARYFSKQEDGLRQRWSGRVWCNPPYSRVIDWVAKAWGSYRDCELIVMLLPANRTDQPWWQTHVEPWRDRGGELQVRFLGGRRRFIRPGTDRIDPRDHPSFGVCLLIWRSL